MEERHVRDGCAADGYLAADLHPDRFLIPYKHVIVQQYGARISIYFGLVTINLYFLCFLIARLILLRDTGRKLVHIEKQLREGSIAHELSDRLSAEE